MTDVLGAVRARLAVLDDLDYRYDYARAGRAVDALRAALLGVMELHAPREPTPVETVELPGHTRGGMVCTVCATSAGALGPRQVYPCETVRVIMGNIGVRDV